MAIVNNCNAPGAASHTHSGRQMRRQVSCTASPRAVPTGYIGWPSVFYKTLQARPSQPLLMAPCAAAGLPETRVAFLHSVQTLTMVSLAGVLAGGSTALLGKPQLLFVAAPTLAALVATTTTLIFVDKVWAASTGFCRVADYGCMTEHGAQLWKAGQKDEASCYFRAATAVDPLGALAAAQKLESLGAIHVAIEFYRMAQSDDRAAGATARTCDIWKRNSGNDTTSELRELADFLYKIQVQTSIARCQQTLAAARRDDAAAL